MERDLRTRLWGLHATLANQEADDLEKLIELATALAEGMRCVRSLVREGGVPRYSVIQGAALNSTIEEVIDPALRCAYKSGLLVLE